MPFTCIAKDMIVAGKDLEAHLASVIATSLSDASISYICDAKLDFQLLNLPEPTIFAGSATLGLLDAQVGAEWSTGAAQLAELSPNYLRAVAAKSIRERMEERAGKV